MPLKLHNQTVFERTIWGNSFTKTEAAGRLSTLSSHAALQTHQSVRRRLSALAPSGLEASTPFLSEGQPNPGLGALGFCALTCSRVASLLMGIEFSTTGQL